MKKLLCVAIGLLTITATVLTAAPPDLGMQVNNAINVMPIEEPPRSEVLTHVKNAMENMSMTSRNWAAFTSSDAHREGGAVIGSQLAGVDITVNGAIVAGAITSEGGAPAGAQLAASVAATAATLAIPIGTGQSP